MEKLTSRQFIEIANENGKFNSRVLHTCFGINYNNDAIYIKHSGPFTINSLKTFMGLKGVKHDDIIILIKNTYSEYRNDFRAVTVDWLDKIEIEYRFFKFLSPMIKPVYSKDYLDYFVVKREFDAYRKDPSCEILAVYQARENRTILHDWTINIKPEEFEYTRFKSKEDPCKCRSLRCSRIDYPNDCHELTIYKEYLDKSGYDRHFNQSRMQFIVYERKENRRKQEVENFDFTPYLNEQAERLNEVLNHVSQLVMCARTSDRINAIKDVFCNWKDGNYYSVLRKYERMSESVSEKSRSLTVREFLRKHNELLSAIDNLSKEINEMISGFSR